MFKKDIWIETIVKQMRSELNGYLDGAAFLELPTQLFEFQARTNLAKRVLNVVCCNKECCEIILWSSLQIDKLENLKSNQ